GFAGTDAHILESARAADPMLLAAACSASAMWTANAATVSPSPDTRDGKVHFTPANLVSQFHRSIEPPTTSRILKAVFPEPAGCFVHHDPLASAPHFGDEGAANHMRLCDGHGEPGVEVFVYACRSFDMSDAGPRIFPARQTYEASAAIARAHQLDPTRVIFLRQNPAAIDAGAFHNDVVAVANRKLLLMHREAYVEPPRHDGVQCLIADMPIADAVKSYVFNSQLLTLPDGTTLLIAPSDCLKAPSARQYIESICGRGRPIESVHYVDVRQSMNNGGGPACLRLRVVLSDAELSKANSGVIWNESLDSKLMQWVGRHYRDSLSPTDLADSMLLDESRAALDELTSILNLGLVYEFQGCRP
ncbi:MAG: N-succinylarginine dihydrolase, partial [Tepidisphaeraceae bacterium]